MAITDLTSKSDKTEIRGINLNLFDAVAGMRLLEEDSIDLAIADPPYGAFSRQPSSLPAGHKLDGFGGAWRATSEKWDVIDPREHLDVTMLWLSEVKRVVAPTGSVWIHASYHNSGFVNVACQLLGLEIINEVVWFKRNAFPNLSGTRLTASHESLLWVHTGGKKRSYRFNYDLIKSMEYVEDSFKSAGKQMRTVWDIPNNKQRSELAAGKHPTQKPERLIQRLIDISAPATGSVLSPFAGSGTDLVVAMRNGLNGTGFETDRAYFDLATRRIQAEARLLDNQMQFPGATG